MFSKLPCRLRDHVMNRLILDFSLDAKVEKEARAWELRQTSSVGSVDRLRLNAEIVTILTSASAVCFDSATPMVTPSISSPKDSGVHARDEPQVCISIVSKAFNVLKFDSSATTFSLFLINQKLHS